jgi:hypothetical protein
VGVQEGILQHLFFYPQSLLIIEEYDKVRTRWGGRCMKPEALPTASDGVVVGCAQMDCPARAVFKQLMDHGTVGDTLDFRKSIIVLEANVGWLEMQELINDAGSREKVSMEAAHRELKATVFDKWKEEKCEDYVDTLKTMSLISMCAPLSPIAHARRGARPSGVTEEKVTRRCRLVPFLPLQKHDLVEVFLDLLRRREHRERLNGNLARLQWTDAVPAWLASKAEYDRWGYTIEGAKEAQTIMTRYVSRALRLQQETPPPQWCAASLRRTRAVACVAPWAAETSRVAPYA